MLLLRLGAERRLSRKRKWSCERVGKVLFLDSIGSTGWERRWFSIFEDRRAWSLEFI